MELVVHVDMQRPLEFHRQGADREASHIGQHQVHKGRFEDQFDVLELVPAKSKVAVPITVPACVNSFWPGDMAVAIPKSATLICPFGETSTFPGLMSR